jgi:sugar (pentulose or hexulose) kinase
MGAAVRGALTEASLSPSDICALCVDTTCCTVVALDSHGQPLRNAILWMDMRAAEQAKRIAAVEDPARKVNGGGRGPISAGEIK